MKLCSTLQCNTHLLVEVSVDFMRDCITVSVSSGAFEGVMIHFEPIGAYNDNWRLC